MKYRTSVALACAAILGAGLALAQQQDPPRRPDQPGTQTDPGKTQTDQPRDESRAQKPSGQTLQRDWFTKPERWQKGSDIVGKPVKNTANEDLGRVEDLAIDVQNGRILYAVLSFGGFLGMGDKFFAIPWSSMQLPSDARHFVLAVDKEQLRNAEGFDKNNWPNFANERWATTTATHYGQRPYWERQGGQGEPVAGRESWYQPATAWQKATDLMGKDVKNPQNEDLGDMENLVIDPDNGRVIYGVVQYQTKYIAVPWAALNLAPDYKHFVLNVPEQRMKEIAGFTRDNWPNLTDENWARQNYTYFNQQPYWLENRARDRDAGERGDSRP